jgi:hypothetical protein
MQPVEHPEASVDPGEALEALRAVARRLVWWQGSQDALADSPRFVAQVMALGTDRDVETTRRVLGEAVFRQVLDHPPAGLFTARRWNYWHVRLGHQRAPPLPRRFKE